MGAAIRVHLCIEAKFVEKENRKMKLRSLLAVLLILLLAPVLPVRAEEADFDSNGVNIHYRIEGQGEPVLLIHGFGMNGLMQWTKLRAALKDRYRLIAIDNRGHGKSGKPHDPEQYGKEMVLDQVRLLDHLGIPKAHIVGYSMGGGIALQMVVDHPDRVQTAVIGGSGWSPPSDDQIAIRQPLIDDLEAGRGFGRLFERLAASDSTEQERKGMQQLGGLLAAMNDQKALAALLRGRWAGMPDEAQIRAINVPMAAIIGELDPIRPAAEKLKELDPETTLIVIPGQTHQTAMGVPEFINGAQQLIAAHPLTAAAE